MLHNYSSCNYIMDNFRECYRNTKSLEKCNKYSVLYIDCILKRTLK